MTTPNFIILGAAKAGTSALHRYLGQHPDIYLPPAKETNFLALDGTTPTFAGPGDGALNAACITSRESYEGAFSGACGERAIGEASPLYLYDERTPEGIKRHVPHARLLAVLRDPVERTLSSFLHMIRDGREETTDFATALSRESQRVERNWEYLWHYTRVSLYAEQVKRYMDHFPKEQILFVLYDDFASDARGFLTLIYRFLEVAPDFEADISIRPNTTGIPRIGPLYDLLSRPNPVKAALQPLLPQPLKRLATSLKLKNMKRPSIPTTVRTSLDELFRPDILALQDLLHRDLSAWMAPKQG